MLCLLIILTCSLRAYFGVYAQLVYILWPTRTIQSTQYDVDAFPFSDIQPPYESCTSHHRPACTLVQFSFPVPLFADQPLAMQCSSPPHLPFVPMDLKKARTPCMLSPSHKCSLPSRTCSLPSRSLPQSVALYTKPSYPTFALYIHRSLPPYTTKAMYFPSGQPLHATCTRFKTLIPRLRSRKHASTPTPARPSLARRLAQREDETYLLSGHAFSALIFN